MHNTKPRKPLFYAPFWTAESGVSREGSEGAAMLWLADYPVRVGERRTVLAPGLDVVGETEVGRVARSEGWDIVTLRAGRPRRGPVLAAWADQRMVQEALDSAATAVCVIGWDEPRWFDALMAESKAVNVMTGKPHPEADSVRLPPMVIAALTELAMRVNHANGLHGYADKRDAREVFAALRESGVRWDADDMWGWSLAHGFTGTEAGEIIVFAKKALEGKKFRGEPDPARISECLQRWQVTTA